jgi:hypothetical protein
LKSEADKVRTQLDSLHVLLRRYGADPADHFLDQLTVLPKDVLFRLSHEALAAELPDTAGVFASLENDEEPTTLSGRALRSFVRDSRSELASMPVFDFAKTFIGQQLARALGETRRSAIKQRLYMDVFFEEEPTASAGLERIQALWLLDPRNASSPDRATAATYRHLDRTSIWAYWSRQLTHPFYVDVGAAGRRLGDGYVCDLRSMASFVPPIDDLDALIRSLLQEADLLRVGSVPSRAFVEINFPPFTMLVFEEINPAFVMVEALDANDRVLPIYLFPSARRWAMPGTGCGPDGKAASFQDVAKVLVTMAAAALRDFWIVEDRKRVLGPPRAARVAGSKRADRRIVYLPRIRYVGGRDLAERAERASDLRARVAHWRSDHYRKLPAGQSPSLRQIMLAEAFKRSPPEGCTWVRGSSIAGVEVEKVYRSRSLSEVLFDVVPSKARALSGLSWFEFEQHCSRWLRGRGFDEVARTSVDRGVDITAISGNDQPLKWAIQCKHWTKKVGPDVVRELEGARILRKADRAMLIVSSAFTQAAITTASELGIELRDGDDLGTSADHSIPDALPNAADS